MAAQQWVLTKEYTQTFPPIGTVNGWACDLVLYQGSEPALYRISLDGPPGISGIDIYESGRTWITKLELGNSVDLEATLLLLSVTPASPEESGEKIWGTYERL